MGDKQTQNYNAGIPSMGGTNVFKRVQAELNTTQNKVLLGLTVAAAAGFLGYVTYVRHKYEQLGYYLAFREDGTKQFVKKRSNWET